MGTPGVAPTVFKRCMTSKFYSKVMTAGRIQEGSSPAEQPTSLYVAAMTTRRWKMNLVAVSYSKRKGKK
jgi:hypothetical protein